MDVRFLWPPFSPNFFVLFSRFIFCTILSASCLRYRVNHPRKKMIGSASMIMMVLIGPCFSPPKKSQEMRDDAATPSTSLITLLLLDPPNTTYSLTLGKKKSISCFFPEKNMFPPHLLALMISLGVVCVLACTVILAV